MGSLKIKIKLLQVSLAFLASFFGGIDMSFIKGYTVMLTMDSSHKSWETWLMFALAITFGIL